MGAEGKVPGGALAGLQGRPTSLEITSPSPEHRQEGPSGNAVCLLEHSTKGAALANATHTGIAKGLGVVTQPAILNSTTDASANDRNFECLKGLSNSPVCTGANPVVFEESWVAEWKGPTGTNQTINQWCTNNGNASGCNYAPLGSSPNGNPNVAYGVNNPTDQTQDFTLAYNSSTKLIEWTIDGQKICNTTSSNPTNCTDPVFDLSRSGSIDTLYIRTASAFGVGRSTSLTNLILNGSALSINTLTSSSSSSITRGINYLVVSGITGDFTLTGTNSFVGDPGGNWQIKAGITPNIPPVPGPLPVLGGMAAFGWSRRLRRRLRQIPSSVSA
jgi:hypothetical protein